MKRCLNFLIGTIFLVRRYTEGADILFFIPFPPVSHHRIVAPLINALAQRGHNITFATPFPRADVLLPSVNIIQLNNMIPLLEGRQLQQYFNYFILRLHKVGLNAPRKMSLGIRNVPWRVQGFFFEGWHTFMRVVRNGQIKPGTEAGW
ncbi:hypothetical protein AAG570_011987 [Ranatra chinensis]|uniref:Uncharacterized protein n=1 Tax=Ranatra chinensis TaxID=642074 RepID=A0ABD0YHT0_9HEMI